jgi:C_GCAxxG_C_C family probable redox protein
MDHVIEAENLFSQGFNCAQAVAAAFCDKLGLNLKAALRLSSPFGGGMARMREVCGAVTGIFMVVGMKYGYSDATDLTAKKFMTRCVTWA